jgi:thiamine biosynthesis lipoprotein
VSAAPFSSQFAALGTTALLSVTDATALEPGRAVLEAELDAIDRACSRFRDDSELVRVNRAAGRPPVAVSPLFAAALEVALRAAELSGGDVDPTVGRALRLAGYDRDFALVPPRGPAPAGEPPPAEDWRRGELDARQATVRMPAGTELDLGATATAFAADRAARRLHATLGAGVLVSLGGDIAVAGPPPPGGWSVGVADDHACADPAERVAVTSGGLATSSTYVRRWRRGGRELHHLIDPRTGLPVVSRWRTVTVAAGSCVDANIASTAAFVRGEEAAPWLVQLRLPGRLVHRDGRILRVAGGPDREPDAA